MSAEAKPECTKIVNFNRREKKEREWRFSRDSVKTNCDVVNLWFKTTWINKYFVLKKGVVFSICEGTYMFSLIQVRTKGEMSLPGALVSSVLCHFLF